MVARAGPKVKAAPDGEEHQDTFRMSEAGLSGQGITMENLARFVGGKVGLVAVDRTELKGVYDFNVNWKVETDQYASALPDYDPREALRHAVFAALQDQLGLKLTPKKIAVQMLVIDNVERASASEN